MSNFLIDEDTGLLAAEFVLGTLDSEERANAQSLLRTDHGFIAMVRIWERRFGELHFLVLHAVVLGRGDLRAAGAGGDAGVAPG